MARRNYAALAAERATQQRQGGLDGPSPFLRCDACKTGTHEACKNRARDPETRQSTDCYCRYMGHEKRGER